MFTTLPSTVAGSCMPPEATPAPDDPHAWLRLARQDLALARVDVAGVGFGLLCFHAQQAAEKAIKGVLISRGVIFPYVHDIGRLLDLAEAAGLHCPAEVAAADILTDYATLARYPGNGEVGAEEHARGVALATEVVAWAEHVIG